MHFLWPSGHSSAVRGPARVVSSSAGAAHEAKRCTKDAKKVEEHVDFALSGEDRLAGEQLHDEAPDGPNLRTVMRIKVDASYSKIWWHTSTAGP